VKTAEFKYLLLKLLALTQTSCHFRLSANHADKQVILHFLAKEKHPFCSQYSLIRDVRDVMLMMLRWPKFVRILINQNKINRTIF